MSVPPPNRRRWYQLSWRRVIVALAYALPGAAIALLAKPLNLGEATLLLGLFLAFAGPLLSLLMEPPHY
jgi:hypothetical protein